MNARWLVAVACAMVCGGVISGGAQQTLYSVPSPVSKVAYLLDIHTGLPERVVLRYTLAPDSQVCYEPAQGIVSCRPMVEFRLWVVARGSAVKGR